jgi:hypothetical protein
MGKFFVLKRYKAISKDSGSDGKYTFYLEIP